MARWCLVVFLVAIALPAVVLSQDPTCTGGKVFQDCGSACPPTCDNQSPFCTFQCVRGCFCPVGMVETRAGNCVSPHQCSAQATPAPTQPTPSCTNNRIYRTCGTACPLTCENYRSPPLICAALCVAGCFCPHGQVQNGEHCVTPDQCPVAATPTPMVCPSGMSFMQCGTACPLTCEHPDPRPCTRQCVPGCFCPNNLLQHDNTCVQRSQCPAVATPPPTGPTTTCTNNRIYETCGTACPITCQNHRNPPFICTANCVIGCFCPRGLVQNGEHCVTPDQCPDEPTTQPPSLTPATPPTPVCTNGQVYETCGSSCPPSCESIHGPPVACTLQCVVGCFCPSGTVSNGGRCVQPQECPQATTSEVVVTPATPTCPSGKVYKECGPVCPLICGPNLCFSLRCAPGCFCPDGMYHHEGGCISQCPTTTEAPATTESVTDVVITEPACTNGRVFSTCMSACPDTCQNIYAPPRPCPLYCRAGCKCPSGLVEDGDRCVPRSQCHNPCDSVRCPSQCVVDYNGRAVCAPDCSLNNGNCSANQICTRNNYTCTPEHYCDMRRFVNCSAAPVTPPPEPVCPSGMSFNQCGTRCPLTCQYPDPRPCVRICERGCFCPQGLLQNNGTCVRREQCPSSPNPCASKTCAESSRCVVSNTTGLAKCVPTCGLNNGGCSDDQTCEIRTIGCDSPNSRQPCDSYIYRMCHDAPFVPCGQDAFLACDSEWTYCLQQNVTRRASCVASCLSRNGNCKDGTVCVTNATSAGSTRLQCLERKDLPTNCPAGQVMNQCGSACQATCGDHLQGPKVCPLICGPPACVCPPHLVLFRDRCVDPRLCYVLTKYPPAIRPLPIVNGNSVLLSMMTSQVSQEAFDTVQSQFLMSVQNTLNTNTDHQVRARLHGIYSDGSSGTSNLIIVVEVSGDSVSQDNAQTYANILNQNSQLLYIEVEQVQPQEVIYVDGGSSESQGLSNTAIIGIAVGSAAVALCFGSIWIALVACCCILNRRMTTKANAAQRSPSPSEKPFMFSDMTAQENDYVVQPLDNKGKLINESLMY